MSHMSVLVVIGPCSPDEFARLAKPDIWDRLSQRLDPFRRRPEDWESVPEEREGPRPPLDAEPQFDWMSIGGRWRGYFTARSGALHLGMPGVPEILDVEDGIVPDPTTRMTNERRTDVILAGDIDWDAMRSANQRDAASAYDQAARAGNAVDEDGGPLSRDAFLDLVAQNYSPVTHAICDADGWHEMPQQGHESKEESQARWEKWTGQWHKITDALDPDTLLVLVDCHQ